MVGSINGCIVSTHMNEQPKQEIKFYYMVLYAISQIGDRWTRTLNILVLNQNSRSKYMKNTLEFEFKGICVS